MQTYWHDFHIPVMGTGHSVDTPIRVAPFGISSAISIVDHLLLEKIRQFYCEKFDFPFTRISRTEWDARAKMITAYLNMVEKIVQMKMEAIKSQPFFGMNDKTKYFNLLPDMSPLKQAYDRLMGIESPEERKALEAELNEKMTPGAIDVNIMVKVDRPGCDGAGKPLAEEFSDAKAALRGYADSVLKSSVIFSAGINQSLYNYAARFNDFYRDKTGELKKKITVKVSDFRSAMIQGKYLARKGLEVSEFRIESGLNCGGHAFASNGHLLPSLLNEFRDKRDQLTRQFQPAILKFYKKMGWDYPESALEERPLVTVQGGIGTNGEARRMTEDYGMDRTGWASPFLLVPEATPVDRTTLTLLKDSEEADLYVSGASPMGVPFNNIRRSGSDRWTRRHAADGSPGSACPKGLLMAPTPFGSRPVCTASKGFQSDRIHEIGDLDLADAEKVRRRDAVTEKVCLCEHLGNGAMIALGIKPEVGSPQAICPGPNIAWFRGEYSLQEMVDHIYGRGRSLVPPERPHMFCKELEMYVDYFEKLVSEGRDTDRWAERVFDFKENLEKGMAHCLEAAGKHPFPGENLASIAPCVARQKARLAGILERFESELKDTPN